MKLNSISLPPKHLPYVQSPPLAPTLPGQWMVAICNPNCHSRAERELAQLGYRTFTPKLRKWVSHARVRKAVDRPLLGRYLFVEIPESEGTEMARRANGVEGFVSVGGRPVVLPEGCVEELIRRQLSGEWDMVAKGELPLGARVQIMGGEFEDMLATLVSKRHGRCDVKLVGTNIIRRMYPLNLRAAV
jgi:transcription antitermination factor NusG